MMTRIALSAAFSLALSAFATPVLAADAKPAGTPEITQQDLNDIATALSIVGSHCSADQVQACQVGADSKLLFAKLQAMFAAQREKDGTKK